MAQQLMERLARAESQNVQQPLVSFATLKQVSAPLQEQQRAIVIVAQQELTKAAEHHALETQLHATMPLAVMLEEEEEEEVQTAWKIFLLPTVSQVAQALWVVEPTKWCAAQNTPHQHSTPIVSVALGTHQHVIQIHVIVII